MKINLLGNRAIKPLDYSYYEYFMSIDFTDLSVYHSELKGSHDIVILLDKLNDCLNGDYIL